MVAMQHDQYWIDGCYFLYDLWKITENLVSAVMLTIYTFSKWTTKKMGNHYPLTNGCLPDWLDGSPSLFCGLWTAGKKPIFSVILHFIIAFYKPCTAINSSYKKQFVDPKNQWWRTLFVLLYIRHSEWRKDLTDATADFLFPQTQDTRHNKTSR